MERPVDDRVLAGVCSGLSRHLGLPKRAVRIAFGVATALGGVGLAAYLLLWVLTPVDRGAVRAASRPRSAARLFLGGVALLVLGGLWYSDAGTPTFGVTLANLLPVVAIVGGAALAWSHLDRSEREEWLGSGRLTDHHGLLRIGIGAVLAVVGSVVLVWRRQGFVLMWDVIFATIAVLAGLVLVLTPWAMRFWRRYQDEQTSRVRETERADIAAHLHDSVLQTLALIQRTDDPQRVTLLARAQERELRTWLYGGVRPSRETLAAAVREVVDEVEDLHGVPVDLVSTGDRPFDEGGEALVGAMREALLNAVRHGAPPVSVYVEVGPRLVEVFVRDRGEGFDIESIPDDRLGVRESIIGRMNRHGGQARIRRLEEGTEVSIRLPVEPEERRAARDSDRDSNREPGGSVGRDGETDDSSESGTEAVGDSDACPYHHEAKPHRVTETARAAVPAPTPTKERTP